MGTGKSTLIDLIQKFYRPESGEIRLPFLDNQNPRLSEWRAQLAIVHQKEKIFNSTVLDNIVLSSEPKEIEAKVLVMQALGCLPLFKDLSQGLLTLCGEEGKNLSGGQRQLIGLARAIVRKPKILILDEATSSMDFELERAVLALVHDYVKDTGAGILLITHHAGLAASMDRVMILEQGQISDHGDASEMVRRENLLSRAFLNVSEPNWR